MSTVCFTNLDHSLPKSMKHTVDEYHTQFEDLLVKDVTQNLGHYWPSITIVTLLIKALVLSFKKSLILENTRYPLSRDVIFRQPLDDFEYLLV